MTLGPFLSILCFMPAHERAIIVITLYCARQASILLHLTCLLFHNMATNNKAGKSELFKTHTKRKKWPQHSFANRSTIHITQSQNDCLCFGNSVTPLRITSLMYSQTPSVTKALKNEIIWCPRQTARVHCILSFSTAKSY